MAAEDELRDAIAAAGGETEGLEDATPAELMRRAASTLKRPQTISVGDGTPEAREARLAQLREAAADPDQGVGNPSADVVRELSLVPHPHGRPTFVTSEVASDLQKRAAAG